MGTPGDKFPIDKVVQGVPSSEPSVQAEEEPVASTSTSTSGPPSEMTILQHMPSLGIFIEHDKPLLLGDDDEEPGLSLGSLEVLEKQLLLDTSAESDNSSTTNMPPLLVDTFGTPPAFFTSHRGEEIQLVSPSPSPEVMLTIQDLSLPGPSGLQTPKMAKPVPGGSAVKAAPKRNKKPPVSSQTPKKLLHTCLVCNKNFQSSAKLASHQLIHSGGTPFKCEHCKKAFSSKFKLVRHVLIHSDRKPFSCTVCERTFHRKDHLKNHIKVHSPSKKVYTCERVNCKKEYTSLMSYRKHLALHSAEEGNLECKICLKVFESKPDILYHLKIHAGSRTVKSPNEKKFTCDYCDRKFFTRKDVRRHLVVHTGTRNFLCQFCPQRFGRKDHLVRHIKKSHSKNFSDADTTDAPPEIKLELEVSPEKLEVAPGMLDFPEEKPKLEIPLLFARGFGELFPTETHSEQLLTGLEVIKEELEGSASASASASGLLETGEASGIEQQLLPSDMMDSDLLRLIGEGGGQVTDDNLPLPGFSQVFKQQEPPPPS